jgi:hypothetical protein
MLIEDKDTLWIVPQWRIEAANDLILQGEQRKEIIALQDSIIQAQGEQIVILDEANLTQEQRYNLLQEVSMNKDSLIEEKDKEIKEEKKKTKKAIIGGVLAFLASLLL